jgi:DedD protein
MATTASIEASEIRRRGRRRLIGAIVLVILAVVFIPMILDSEPRPKQNDMPLEIPAKDKVAPLPPPTRASEPAPAPAPAPAPTPAPAQTSAPIPSKTVTPAEAGAQKPKAEAASSPKAEASAPKLEGFAVQVGAFKDEAKLNQAREKLMAAKIPHFVERRGDLNRLRAGPFATREAAEKALATLKAASLDGQVVPLP